MIEDGEGTQRYVDLFTININPDVEGDKLFDIIYQGLEIVRLEKPKYMHYRQEDNDLSSFGRSDLDDFYRQTEYAFMHYDLGKYVPGKDRYSRIILYHDDSLF